MGDASEKDPDIDAFSWDDLEFFCEMLREANLQKKLKARIREELGKLAAVEIEINVRTGDTRDRRRIERTLLRLNEGPLGTGLASWHSPQLDRPMTWNPHHRSKGALGTNSDPEIDQAIIGKARELMKAGSPRKTVLGAFVMEALSDGRLSNAAQPSSHVRRLLRTMDRQESQLKALHEGGVRELEFINDLTKNKGISPARALQILRDRRTSQAQLSRQKFRDGRGGTPWPSSPSHLKSRV
jgi:hypothetical protein